MNIYLTGYMASGKTYIGRHLAQKLDIPFIDLDACIVERYEQTVSAIFAAEGEAAFRQKETETLKSIPVTANAIVSCGGGTFCFPQNRDWIKEQGISIYLKVTVNILFNRLSAKEESRPIIKANNGTAEELRTFIETHLASRET
ncbi:MAG: shikimate kinase, partial [Flavobacteriales bacterium]